MNILGYRLLTDENIHPEVVKYLRFKGFDVFDTKEEGLRGKKDMEPIS